MLAFKIWLQSYIRPVTQTRSLPALMEFAGEALISLESSKDLKPFRFTSPRSDLFRHHFSVNLRNLSAVHTPFVKVYFSHGICRVIHLKRSVMRQQRPDRAGHLVRQRHSCGIVWPS
jgi:hypothetical protein